MYIYAKSVDAQRAVGASRKDGGNSKCAYMLQLITVLPFVYMYVCKL